LFGFSKPESYAVATRHHLATDIGIEILEKGGNAVDAAVAVAFALAVVNPSAGNLGGGGFMIIHNSSSKSIKAIDYREKAPIKSFETMFQDSEGNVIEGLSTNSILASGIPGTVAGLFHALENYGTMDIKTLIEPSIELAKNGFPLSSFQSGNLNKYKKKFSRDNNAKIIFTRPEDFKANDLLIQKDLANTLERIAKNGREEFYSGETSKKIVNYFKKEGGLLSHQDFKNYEVREFDAICGIYKNNKVCSMPPPSSGGIALIQMLNVLENFDLENTKHNSVEYINILQSVMNYAFFDRSLYLGDPNFLDIPEMELTSKNYAKKVYEKIKKNVAPKDSKIIFRESDETTHFSIIDKWGNAVSNTYTLNTAYGSGIVPEGTGILMNNEMDDFSSKPGYPNVYGLVGSEANKIEPMKSPLSSMSPVIVFYKDSPKLITGSPGGSTIITTVLQEILNIIDFEMDLEESAKKSRIHFQHKPDILFYEDLNIETMNLLSIDRKLFKRQLGETHSILIKNNKIQAFSDERRPDGKAISVYK
tara:strand:+ start:3684 stop:5285 length:1602 start_codon:yes stop_codon:yes gene_type:complete